MIAVRYHQRDGVIQVRRLHASMTQGQAQRLIDLAIDTDGVVQLWGADDTLVEFAPAECTEIQVLELQRA